MERRTFGKQIRCYVSAKAFDELKKESKEFGLSLAQLCGMKLSGLEINKVKK